MRKEARGTDTDTYNITVAITIGQSGVRPEIDEFFDNASISSDVQDGVSMSSIDGMNPDQRIKGLCGVDVSKDIAQAAHIARGGQNKEGFQLLVLPVAVVAVAVRIRIAGSRLCQEEESAKEEGRQHSL